ncbi:hypothetical protein E8E14_010370 [Neopestalotiopsis sp. 37M]|nr:hypothetical protein E8E14_010370 [Neopestalotiopsis sp. 37M]
MSGFEVLGVLLGTIPLVISAVEHYQEGLHTVRRWRSYEAELQSLKRSLDNEKAIFLNTCQQLLSGVIGSIEHEKLIDEPFGELWSKPQIRDQIALRLDHVYEPFKATVVAMYDALREIQRKLGLDERGNVKWMEGKAIVRELKRATFTFKRSHFDEILASISKNNHDLQTLTNQSIQLEPERRVRYHGRLFSQVKEALRSIYEAIRNSLACKCPGSHQVSLRLAKPKLMPRNEDSYGLRNSNFQCAVSYLMDNSNPLQRDEVWNVIVLRLYEPSPKSPGLAPPRTHAPQKEPITPGITTPTPIRISESRKSLQRVRFSEETRSSSESTSSPISVKTVLSAFNPTITAFASRGTEIPTASVQEYDLNNPIDLCKFARKGKSKHSTECIGFVSNNTSPRYPKFGVFSEVENEGITSMISLRTVIEDSGKTFPAVLYADGFKLAVDISSGILQLINTSWLPGRITSRDILFPTENGYPLYSKPFFAKKVLNPEQEPWISDEALRLQTLRRLLFSLGILLFEILLFESLDHVWDTEMERGTARAVGGLTDRKAVANLLGRAQTLGSSNFYSAVRRFLFCDFTCLDFTLRDEAFCREVYGKTIALMEEDFQSSQQLWMLPYSKQETTNTFGDARQAKSPLATPTCANHDDSVLALPVMKLAGTEGSFEKSATQDDSERQSETIQCTQLTPTCDVENKVNDLVLVDWTSSTDNGNPKNWSLYKKLRVYIIINYANAAVYMSSSIYAASQEGVMHDFHVSQTVASLGLALFVLGYGLGPLIFSPLADNARIGRNPPYVVSSIIFLTLSILTATAQDITSLLILRLFRGFFGSPVLSFGGASLFDVCHSDVQPIALYTWACSGFAAPSIAPIISGFAIPVLGWRWSLWEIVIVNGPSVMLMKPRPEGYCISGHKDSPRRTETGTIEVLWIQSIINPPDK